MMTMTSKKIKTIRPDFWLIKFDQTEYWHLEPRLMQYIKRIIQICLMDRNENTYCCEMTPSYCLFPVETRADLHDPLYDGSNASEQLRDEIESEISRWQDADCFYIHCRSVDNLLALNNPARCHHYGDTGVDYEESPYEEQLEALVEHFQGNQYL